MNKLIDFILIVGFFTILVWGIIDILPMIRQIIGVLFQK